MRALVLAALIAAPALAGPPLVYRQGDNSLTLHDSPCVHGGTLALLAPEWRPKFKKAHTVLKGKTIYACWIEEAGLAFVMYEDGDQIVYRLDLFRDEGA